MREYFTEATFTVDDDETIVKDVLLQAQQFPKRVLFTRPQNFEWVNVTAAEFVEEFIATAKGLIANGVQPGDRVALLSETRYEWSVLDFAIWAAGGVVVPIFASSSASQIRWIVENSGAVFAITENAAHTELMKPLVIGPHGPGYVDSESQLRRIIEINSGGMGTLEFEGRDIADSEVTARIEATTGSDLSSLVYTSGTTGRPKGCMLTHRNWLFEVRTLLSHEIGRVAAPGNRVLTFLPMAHVLARAVSLACVVAGTTQSHWGDPSTVSVEFQRSRPHLILGVPRVFEKVRNSAHRNAKESGPLKEGIFLQAEKTAIEYSRALDTENGPSRALSLRHMAFDKLVFSKIRAAMGDAVQYTISGGSSLSPRLQHFYRGMGVPTYEGYGLTESTAAICVNAKGDMKVGTVGRPVGGCGVRISDEGEIMLTGGVVFQGYWGLPEETARDFEGEYFNTGDLGELDEDGFLTITGRKKDLIVTAGGKNVSPGPMEDILRTHPLISQAMVVGDGLPFIACLITLDEEAMRKWRLDRNIPENTPLKELATNSLLRAEIQDAVNDVNRTVSHTEAIKKFQILDRDLTEKDNELTATMKVKRNVVAKRFAEEIEKMYRR